MRAARVAWLLEYAGMRIPLMLEGGFRAWKDFKYPVGKRGRVTVPRIFKAHPDPAVLATARYVRSLSTAPNGVVLDVRSRGEYDGSENRECCPRSGRVPGAVWFEWTNFLSGKGGFQSRQSINKQLRSMGLQPAMRQCLRESESPILRLFSQAASIGLSQHACTAAASRLTFPNRRNHG